VVWCFEKVPDVELRVLVVEVRVDGLPIVMRGMGQGFQQAARAMQRAERKEWPRTEKPMAESGRRVQDGTRNGYEYCHGRVRFLPSTDRTNIFSMHQDKPGWGQNLMKYKKPT
jgi:hypothetical protein